MSTAYTLLHDLAQQIEPPKDGTLNRTICQDAHLKAVLFGFSAGQELSEHTASTPAVMHFLSREAEVGLGEDTATVQGGAWIHMPARLPHRILATTPVTMLLLLLKNPEDEHRGTV